LILEALGKRNMGNSYHRFRTPGTDVASEWPYEYRAHYFPVAEGSKFPAYRYMNANWNTTLKTERVFTVQPFMKGANFAAGYPVNLSILKEKGFNLGSINKINLAYIFMAEGTGLGMLNPPAENFEVMIPTKYEGTALDKWYLYDWNAKAFVETTALKSSTSGANFVKVTAPFIGEGHNVVLIAASVAVDPGGLPFPDLGALLDKDVTAKGKQDLKSGKVTVTITNSGLKDGEDVTFFFVKGKDDFVMVKKAVKEVAPGVFEAVFTTDELKNLKDGTKYAIQYINSDGTVKGFSTFNNGAFTYCNISDEIGCDAGLGYAVVGLFAILVLARKRSK
jgi:hypothetical protein